MACPTCENGLVFLRHKVTKGIFVFKCTCIMGNRYAYPEYKTILMADYERDELPSQVVRSIFLKGPDKSPVDVEDDICPF
jgi:hypothetical protein